MKKKLLFIISLVLLHFVHAQEKLITRTAKVTFESKTDTEAFSAKNTQVASILISDTKTIAFNALLKSFRFEKALMEEHFNEKYVNSETYPSAKFKGRIIENIDLNKVGMYDVSIQGKMNFHGVEQSIKTVAKVIVNDDHTINITSNFKMNLDTYQIRIPAIVKEKISEDIVVTVNAHYKKSK